MFRSFLFAVNKFSCGVSEYHSSNLRINSFYCEDFRLLWLVYGFLITLFKKCKIVVDPTFQTFQFILFEGFHKYLGIKAELCLKPSPPSRRNDQLRHSKCTFGILFISNRHIYSQKGGQF